MRRELKVPEIAWWIFSGSMVVYLASPVLFWQWLVIELENGAFPVHADSIGIPFVGFLLVWLVGLFVIGFVALLVGSFERLRNQ